MRFFFDKPTADQNVQVGGADAVIAGLGAAALIVGEVRTNGLAYADMEGSETLPLYERNAPA